MNAKSRILFAALLPLFGGWSSCDPSLNHDPSFDLWCGSSLCLWSTDRGSIAKVPTWHEDDSGVELLGNDAQISQLLQETGTQTPRCMRFEMMTDIDPDASVTLALDFGDDGVAEYQAPVPATKWESVSFNVTPPTWYPSVRIILHKTGAGRAVLTQIRLTAPSDCTGTPLAYDGRPDAAPCQSDPQCQSGRCGDSVFPYVGWDPAPLACGGCKAASDCASLQVCGVATSELGMHSECVAAGLAKFGDRCLADTECATGVCCGQVCSSCCQSHPCGGSDACAQPADPSDGKLLWVVRPWLCASGKGRGAAGDTCLADSDCQSGSCQGSGNLQVCWLDGRRCQKAEDCPAQGQDPNNPLLTCLSLGKDEGLCR
jgi:hypothetical protein